MSNAEDLRLHPGYKGHLGPPNDFVPDPANSRLWSANHCDNARFGGRLRGVDERDERGYPCGPPFPCTPETAPTPNNPEPPTRLGPNFYPGFADLESLHPMRAMNLAGSVVVTPGKEYTLAQTLQMGPIDRWHSQEHTWHTVTSGLPVQPSDGDVTLPFVGRGDFHGIGNFLDIYLNPDTANVWAGKVFRDVGKPPTQLSWHTVQITAADWNAALGDGGVMTLRVVATNVVEPHPDSFIRWSGSYRSADEVEHLFSNTRVCFHHAGHGYALAENGFAVPTTLHQPDQAGPVVASVGAFWCVKEEERFDGLGHAIVGERAAEVGGPGFAVAVLPVQLPPTVESLFASYPVWCHVPTAP